VRAGESGLPADRTWRKRLTRPACYTTWESSSQNGKRTWRMRSRSGQRNPYRTPSSGLLKPITPVDHPAILLAVAGHHAGLSNFCDKDNELETQRPRTSPRSNNILPFARLNSRTSRMPNFPLRFREPIPTLGADTSSGFECFSRPCGCRSPGHRAISTGRDRFVVDLAAASLLDQLTGSGYLELPTALTIP